MPHLHRSVGRPPFRTAGPQISPPAGQEDRGCAFFSTVIGRVVAELAAALDPTEPELFWGDDAHEQPGYCADVLLYETAAAWIRKGLSTSVPRTPWKETRAQYGARLRHLVAAMNGHHDVDGALQRPAGPPGRAKTPPGRPVELIDREKDHAHVSPRGNHHSAATPFML